MMCVSLCFPICVGNDSAAANKIYLWVLIKELELKLELEAAVIPAACAPFPTTIFPSTQLSMNMLG